MSHTPNSIAAIVIRGRLSLALGTVILYIKTQSW
jgi:hypothetical protein